MKQLKLLGLAFVAAVALTAFLGTGTASATELCSKASTPCLGTKYGTGTATSTVNSTNAVLKTSITTVTCVISSLDGTTTSGGGSGTTAVTGITTEFHFFACTDSGGEECTVIAGAKNLGNISITGGSASETAAFNYNITSKTGVHVECGFFINCTFYTESTTLAGHNQISGAPTIRAEEAVMKREGGFCPESATWTGTYKIVNPSPLYVV
jgi:hypothetical protein